MSFKKLTTTCVPLSIENIDTDQVIPARFLKSISREGFGENLFRDWRYLPGDVPNPEFALNDQRFKGQILVAGKNFGCGSSREHAQISIKGAGISCVIAESFARIFLRNAINMGLAILEIKDISGIKEGDYLEVDLSAGSILNLTEHKGYKAKPLPKFIQEIIRSGGLLKWVNKRGTTRKKKQSRNLRGII